MVGSALGPSLKLLSAQFRVADSLDVDLLNLRCFSISDDVTTSVKLV